MILSIFIYDYLTHVIKKLIERGFNIPQLRQRVALITKYFINPVHREKSADGCTIT